MNKKTISIDDFEQTTTVISEEATKAVKGERVVRLRNLLLVKI